MLYKLALRNAKRSFKDYFLYLVTMSLITSFMFAFNSMIFSSDVKKICSMAGVMTGLMIFATVFIVLIVAWLVKYMVRFMMEKRSKEFGTYLLLGIKNKEIATLFIRENACLGILAFLMGILPGILMQQILTSIFYSFFKKSYQLEIGFSIGSFLMTLCVYAVIYALTLLRSKRLFRKMSIQDMIYMDRQNEQLKNENIKFKSILFIISVLYFLFFDVCVVFEKITITNIWFLLLGLVAAVYLFYTGLAAFIVRYINKGRRRIYNNMNLFLFRQLASKIKTMRFTMGTLTVLFIFTLLGGTIAMMFNDFQNKQLENELPFDIIIFSDKTKDDFHKQLNIIENNSEIKKKLIYNVYENKTDDVNQYLYHNLEYFKNALCSPDPDKHSDNNEYFQYDTYMKLSDYNTLRRMLGYKDISLPENGYLIHAKDRIVPTLRGFAEKQDLQAGDKALKFAGFHEEPFAQSGENGADYIIVIPDKAAESMTPFYSLLAVDLKSDAPDGLYDKLNGMNNYYDDNGNMKCRIIWGYGTNQILTVSDTVLVKTNLSNQMKFFFSAISFPLIYIGLVFICVALTILSVQQLSDSSKYKFRYMVLNKLGLKEREIDRTILQQLLLYYLCPFLTALLITSVVAVFLSNRFIFYTGIHTPVYQYFGLSVAAFSFVYILYFAVTYIQFVKTVHE